MNVFFFWQKIIFEKLVLKHLKKFIHQIQILTI